MIVFKTWLLFSAHAEDGGIIVRMVMCLMTLCFLLSTPGFSESANIHAYPREKDAQIATSQLEQNQIPSFGGCEIEIINDSFSNVAVYGRYDDGVPLVPFNVYSYEVSHFIDLYYNGYCHSGIYLSIVTFSGNTIFSGWVYTGSTLHLVPMLSHRVKVTVEKEASHDISARNAHATRP